LLIWQVIFDVLKPSGNELTMVDKPIFLLE